MRHLFSLAASALLLPILGLLSPSPAATFEEQVALGRASLRRALNLGDPAALELARHAFLSAVEQAPERRLGHYYLALADWQLALALGASPAGRDRVGELAREGVRHCDALLERGGENAEALALRGGLRALWSTVPGDAAAGLAEAGESDLRRSLSLGGGSPRVWLICGASHSECARARGQSEDGALRDVMRALELFERVPQSLQELSGGTPEAELRGRVEALGGPPLPEGSANGAAAPSGSGAESAGRVRSLEPDWGHEEAWLLAGRLHLAADRMDAARRCFLKVLEINPASEQVRNHYLPRAGGSAAGSRSGGGASRSLPGAPQSTPPGLPLRGGERR